jgi:hypothetical protein
MTLRLERALFKLIDLRWRLADQRGYLAGDNRPPAVHGDVGPGPVAVVLATEFPAAPGGETERVTEELRAGSQSVRVEALTRPARVDRRLRGVVGIAYAEDDSPVDRFRAAIWLVRRHPIRTIRQVISRRSPQAVTPLRVLAPTARRCARAQARVLAAEPAASFVLPWAPRLEAITPGATIRSAESDAGRG